MKKVIINHHLNVSETQKLRTPRNYNLWKVESLFVTFLYFWIKSINYFSIILYSNFIKSLY